MGNHDIWPYQWDWEKGKVAWDAKRPLTITEFERYFEENLEVPWLSRQNGPFQNYRFTFQGIKFIVTDNVNRRKVLFGLPGVVAWAKLYEDSKRWLEEKVTRAMESQAIIFSHSPLKIRMLEKLLEQSRRVREIVNISGHRHKITEKKENEITIITTNALYLKPSFLKVLISEKIQFQHQAL